MKKILFIFHDTHMTGASIALLRIIETLIILNKYDINILFTSIDGPILDLLKQHNVKIHLLEKHGRGSLFIKFFTRLIYFFQYAFFLMKETPNLLYSNTLMNIGEVIIARLMGIYTLVHSHEGKNIIQRYAHYIKLEDYFTEEYIVVSQYALKSLQMFTNQRNNKHVIYNGIQRISKKMPLFSKDTTIKLSVIATIDKNKSQMTAVKALEYLLQSTTLQLELNLFGKIADNQYFMELQKYIEAKKLIDYVHFHGEFLNQIDMYKQTDILLITSKDETFSLTALEGFNYLKPVIASDTGGLPEVVNNHVNGLLFKVDDFQELAQKIVTIINNDLLRQQMLQNAYNSINDKFQIDENTKKIVQLIDKSLKDFS